MKSTNHSISGGAVEMSHNGSNGGGKTNQGANKCISIVIKPTVVVSNGPKVANPSQHDTAWISKVNIDKQIEEIMSSEQSIDVLFGGIKVTF